ncbi:Coenzyme F420 hydrogenase/dehydrogenase, beta subunit C-terminal domain [Methanoculleus sp.]|uniref:Coenzyme F420 hydrogenase/dehydrogenase, beta subunit C-terminal domain n=1 Tax=Methanoculleus sp. TaxID=90427 RepID=UPI001BD3DBEC|nr:Coenzyme F420 hydrogenase/dehydrogenase, beta subunit C-terminal domain [Methanoculleus sp.]
MKTIKDLDLRYICTGCGACSAICTQDAISMVPSDEHFYPELNDDYCIRCGRCLAVCPGQTSDIKAIGDWLWPKSKYDAKIGKYLSTHVGYSLDETIRYESASGGMATSFILYLLNERIIDGAIITRMNSTDPLLAETIIARTSEEVLQAQGSKYSPTSPVEALKHIKSIKTEEKYAFVGLPCHIHGVRNLQKKEEWARKRIIITIGLFCSHTVSFLGNKFLLNKFADGTQNVSNITYRGRGWPGGLCVTYNDGKSVNVPLKDYWAPYFGSYFFTPYRCLVCPDLSSELADISLGDAWLGEITEQDKLGTSMIIVRSLIASKLLSDMETKGYIALTEVSINKAIESQKGILARKKDYLGSRIRLFELFKKSVPVYDQKFTSTIVGYIGAILIYPNAYVSKTVWGQRFLYYIPLTVLKAYSVFIKLIMYPR